MFSKSNWQGKLLSAVTGEITIMKKATTAVIQHKGKVLIALRGKDNFWEFPGGKIDPGETPEACIIREIKEELNMTVRIEESLGCLEGIYRNMEMQLYAFLTSWTQGEVVMNVHKEVKWVEYEELDQYMLVEEDRAVLNQFLMENLRNRSDNGSGNAG